jgi:hypothetical protein
MTPTSASLADGTFLLESNATILAYSLTAVALISTCLIGALVWNRFRRGRDWKRVVLKLNNPLYFRPFCFWFGITVMLWIYISEFFLSFYGFSVKPQHVELHYVWPMKSELLARTNLLGGVLKMPNHGSGYLRVLMRDAQQFKSVGILGRDRSKATEALRQIDAAVIKP